MENVEKIISKIESNGAKAKFFNINAADQEKRNQCLDEVKEIIANSEKKIKILLHSLAFGSLKPYISDDPEKNVTQKYGYDLGCNGQLISLLVTRCIFQKTI